MFIYIYTKKYHYINVMIKNYSIYIFYLKYLEFLRNKWSKLGLGGL